ncbi:MAG: hypothetical protein ACXU9U_03485 [Parachlamydiaceae bacterium]
MRILYLTLLLSCLSLQAAQDLPVIETPPLKDPKEIIDLQLKSLDHLIILTDETSKSLVNIRATIVNYQKVQNLYLDTPSDKELLYRMTKTAHLLLKEIKTKNLTHAFDPEFISELATLARIYQSHELPSS